MADDHHQIYKVNSAYMCVGQILQQLTRKQSSTLAEILAAADWHQPAFLFARVSAPSCCKAAGDIASSSIQRACAIQAWDRSIRAWQSRIAGSSCWRTCSGWNAVDAGLASHRGGWALRRDRGCCAQRRGVIASSRLWRNWCTCTDQMPISDVLLCCL